ncbi:MAG: hypothetical protein ABIH86_06395 [Planctomycetota bacterium]
MTPSQRRLSERNNSTSNPNANDINEYLNAIPTTEKQLWSSFFLDRTNKRAQKQLFDYYQPELLPKTQRTDDARRSDPEAENNALLRLYKAIENFDPFRTDGSAADKFRVYFESYSHFAQKDVKRQQSPYKKDDLRLVNKLRDLRARLASEGLTNPSSSLLSSILGVSTKKFNQIIDIDKGTVSLQQIGKAVGDSETPDWEPAAHNAPDPSERLMMEDALDDLLDVLDDRERRVFVMHGINGKPMNEIAQDEAKYGRAVEPSRIAQIFKDARRKVGDRYEKLNGRINRSGDYAKSKSMIEWLEDKIGRQFAGGCNRHHRLYRELTKDMSEREMRIVQDIQSISKREKIPQGRVLAIYAATARSLIARSKMMA